MSNSKLSHSVGNKDKTTSAPAQAFQGAPDGNISGMGGTGNPAGTGSARQADGPSQEIAGTLPNDFTLSGMKESGDKTIPNDSTGNEGDPLTSAGRGGDSVHKGPIQSHEFDVPQTEDRSRPRENIGQ
ncbi:MAG: hypothetical protein CYPHOPRED_005873 [Cyphobasidiales sp. Tagirdzhanova-0007]|nr:MAG: hypothetical protein CYPHOPRED_005873 [Cyphobasidiales sp. Tagirdzhanova-0007]